MYHQTDTGTITVGNADGDFIQWESVDQRSIAYIEGVLTIRLYGQDAPLEIEALDTNTVHQLLGITTDTPVAANRGETITQITTRTLNINRINRLPTHNSWQSWQIFDDEQNQQVNIVKNTHTWNLVVIAGLADTFNSLAVDQERSFIPPLTVTVTNDGNNLVSIETTPPADEPNPLEVAAQMIDPTPPADEPNPLEVAAQMIDPTPPRINPAALIEIPPTGSSLRQATAELTLDDDPDDQPTDTDLKPATEDSQNG
jgi:hypothetical protein